MDDQIEKYLPLTESTFFILLSLSVDSKHGYAIMKDVRELSAGRVHLSTGTLYGAVDRLVSSGWIVQIEKAENNTDQRPRKYYELSHFGLQILKAETSRMRALVSMARRRITEK